ncbi:probable ATP-dependent RNA helicase DDX43 isoform X2 [Zootermopsis nevadensis]|nr:probable ATP-dependent RNA helicase DDX43 isoform X2 [Zootermopsis nevadensis]XP_021914079.1 probable ATP-dependent RNA helicase DDX43 isoform X2 [Zootermopsis nevadensis]XP_021914080.1 probable ATP-dependent RNA helicase DDX43 isoform X2 [Zootermopsis nevadensis]
MNDGWESDGESHIQHTPVYSQTFSRGGSRRGGGTGCDYGNWQGGGRNNYRSNNPAEEKENEQGSGRFDHNRGRHRGGGSWRENSSGGPSGYGGGSGDGTKVMIKSSDVGKVIGKGGSKIRELQGESGAHIQIGKPSDEDFGQTTSVIVSGSGESVAKAKQLIEDFLNNFNSRSNGSSGNISGSGNGVYGTAVSESEPKKPPVINWAEVNRIYDEAQKERWNKCPPLLKDFYIEDPHVASMLPEEVQKLRKEKNNIVVTYVFEEGENAIPNPVRTFEQCFAHYPDILEEIYKQNFEVPSPIQCQAWPILLKGHDLIGIAQTGTGKTLAFLLPALIHIDKQPVPRSQRGGANVLVMAPTRELALQIEKEVKKYSYRNIKCVCVYGGGNRREQVNLVAEGIEIIIATPGRLNDLVMAGIIDVKSVTYLVLDEADRMLDMGFEPQIRKILLDIRPDRQTVMTSATWPEGVRRLAQSYMKNPIQVFIGTLDLAAVHSVTQRIELIKEEDKSALLREFIDNMEPDDKVIVFVGKKTRADDISSELSLEGIKCQSIHGNREQYDREQALEDLKTGEVRILIATDVASRGIDIEDVTHIFNYDFPRNIEEYVHRVGRTGRAGKTGESISLITREDWAQAKELIAILEEANQEVPEELTKMAERFNVWKEKKAAEKERERMDLRGCRGEGRSSRSSFGGGGGGRRDRGKW